MLFKSRLARALETAKQQRMATKRTEFVPLCGKKRKNQQKVPGQQDRGLAPKRLTPEEIRVLGGLRNATKLVRDYEAKTKSQGRESFVAKKFRKRKKTPAEIATEKENLRRAELEEAPQHLKNLYGTDMNENPPRLVIDGYNVLSEMTKQDKRRFRGKELAEQRDLFETDVRIFSQGRGVRACIVYDAAGNPYPDASTNRQTADGVDTVYCTSYEADLGLKIESERYLAEGTPEITVVTSDNAARDACGRPPFIFCQSSKLFLREIRRCKKDLRQALEAQEMVPMRTMLRKSLSRETLSDLQALRDALIEGKNERNNH